MLKELIYNFLEFISSSIVVLFFLITYQNWKRTNYLRVLFLYFLCSFINLGIATYLAFGNKENLVWYDINGFSSLLFLSLFFYRIIQQSGNKKKISYCSAAGLLSYVLVLVIWDDHKTFYSTGYAIVALEVILFSFLFLKEVFAVAGSNQPLTIHTDMLVWIVSGFLTYYLSAFFIHVTLKLATKYFQQRSPHVDKALGFLWGIQNIIYFFSCVFILIHFFKMLKPEQPSIPIPPPPE